MEDSKIPLAERDSEKAEPSVSEEKVEETLKVWRISSINQCPLKSSKVFLLICEAFLGSIASGQMLLDKPRKALDDS